MGGDGERVGKHPADEQLIAFANGESEDEAAAAVAAHVDDCAACAATLARYRLVRDVLRVAEAPEPPPELLARAKGLFGSRVGQERTPRPDRFEPLRRVIARLVFDSGAGPSPAVAGFRGGGDRHLTYVAGAVQVDLRLLPPAAQGGPWRVQGQIDADALQPATAVAMVPAGEELAVARTTADEHGMFDLAAPSGRYDLLVRLPSALQVLPGLDLG